MSTAILDGKKLTLQLCSTINFERTKANMEITGVWYETALWKYWHLIKNDPTFQGVELHEKPLNPWLLWNLDAISCLETKPAPDRLRLFLYFVTHRNDKDNPRCKESV